MTGVVDVPVRPKVPDAAPEFVPDFGTRLRIRLRTPDEFQRWLDSYGPNDVVGHAGNPFHCPLHTWLKATFFTTGRLQVGQHSITYSTHRFLPFIGLRHEPLPRWAERFVKGVDNYTGPVTAGTALRVLTRW